MIHSLINKQSRKFFNIWAQRDSDQFRRDTMTTSVFPVDDVPHTFRITSHRSRHLETQPEKNIARYEMSITFEIEGMIRILAFFYGQMRAGTRGIPGVQNFDPDSMKCEVTTMRDFTEAELEHVLMMLFLTYEPVE